MKYSELLSGDEFSFATDPETRYVKMSRTAYRPVWTEQSHPEARVLKDDPEVTVTHDGFMTFRQLPIGTEFTFCQRRTMRMVKTGLSTYQILNGPNHYKGEDFQEFGDCLVER